MQVRHLRRLSGITLWCYIASHLGNHVLGLWSLQAAEAGLKLALWLWHSWPGTLALYGAFACHLALALFGLAQRHSWRLPWSEWLRIAFGLSFPWLLVGHAVTTRVAYEWYGQVPQYQGVVLSLLHAGAQGRQLALLAPGWLHGCMGLHLALRHQAWYRRGRWWCWALAAGLPVLAAAGFLAMDQEVSRLLHDPGWRAQLAPPLPAAQAQALRDVREQILGAYLLLLAAVIVARVLRWAWRSRQQGSGSR